MKSFGDRVFSSQDKCFRIVLTAGVLQRMVRTCAEADRRETGGILAGNYSSDQRSAVATLMTGPPGDSKSGRTWLTRGIIGLKDWLSELWKRKVAYYLGEWHFHPNAPPIPSNTDTAQLRVIAALPQYACPEPILVIIGGNPAGRWTLSVTIFDGLNCIQLLESE